MTTPLNRAKQIWWSIERILVLMGYEMPVSKSHCAAVIQHEEVDLDIDVVKGGQNFKGEDAKRGTV